jgi:hypothetical protein
VCQQFFDVASNGFNNKRFMVVVLKLNVEVRRLRILVLRDRLSTTRAIGNEWEEDVERPISMSPRIRKEKIGILSRTSYCRHIGREYQCGMRRRLN